MGDTDIRSLLCLLGMINTAEMNSLFSLRITIPRHDNAESRTHPHFHNGSGNGELHPEAAGVAGLGLIQAPLLAIGRYLESGALIELLPDFQHKPLDVSLVVAHRRNLSRRVRAFMKWIENVLAPHLE